MNSREKILALDYGSRFIGLAVGDSAFGIAFPKGKIANNTQEQVLEKLREFIIAERIQRVVVGMPTSLTGTASDQEKDTEVFYAYLQKELDVPVEIFDERFTTKMSTQRMQTLSKNSREIRAVKDELSAQLILEGYFQRHAKKD